MVCPHCGEHTLSTGQRYCQACGGMLRTGERTAVANAVGDGRVPPGLASRALAAFLIAPPAGRGAMALGLLITIASALLIVAAIVSAVVALIAAATPLIVFCTFIYLVARRKRRRWI